MAEGDGESLGCERANMNSSNDFSRRHFLTTIGSAAGLAAMGSWPSQSVLVSQVTTPNAGMAALRRAIVDTPVGVAKHRARVFTKVFQEN